MLNWILLGIGVLVIIGLVMLLYSDTDGELSKSFKIILLCIGLFLIVFSQSFTIIPTGYTGVRSIFGQIKEKPANTGFNFKTPFVEKVDEINNKQQDIKFDDNKIVSETSERNEVTFTGITVTYKINKDYSTWICRNVSDWEDSLVNESLIASAIKATSKQLNPVEVTNRAILEPKAQEFVQKSLDNKYGKGVIDVVKVIINNAQFDKVYDEKLAQKQQAQMEYEKQAINNKKNVEKAEADAKVKKTEAEGEAKANKTINKSLTDKVLKEKVLNKWDGTLPKVQNGKGTIIDIGNIND